MNYAQRAERISKYLLQDVIFAYGRAKAVYAGMRGVYEIDLPMPVLNVDGYLDKLVAWTRKVSYKYNMLNEQRSVFEQVFSIRSKANNLAGTKPFMTTAEYKNGLSTGNFNFTIPADFFPDELLNLRLVGITLSCDYASLSGTNVGTHKTVIWKAVVFPPEQTNLYDFTGKSEIDSKAVIFDSLSITEGRKSFNKSNAVQNIKPAGIWNIKVPHYALYGTPENHSKRIRGTKLIDIKLHLLLESDFESSEPGDWSEFWTK